MDRIVQFILQKRLIAFAFIVSAFAALGQLAHFANKGFFAADFGMYWRVANEPLSMAYLPSNDLPFPYLPTMLLWIEPLAFLPLWPSFFFWSAASGALLWFACRRHLSASATTLVLISPPMIASFFPGQVSGMLAAALLWACGTRNRIAAGIALGIIASIKPQFVILAPLLLLFRQDWRALLGSASTFFLLAAASIVAFGLDIWFVWFASLDDFRATVTDQQWLSTLITPAAAAEYWGIPPFPIMILGAIIGAWLIFKCRNQPPLVLAAAVGGGSLLVAPYGLSQDLAVIVPFLSWSVFQGRITAALAMSGALNPLPLFLTAFELAKQPAVGRSEGDDCKPGLPDNRIAKESPA